MWYGQRRQAAAFCGVFPPGRPESPVQCCDMAVVKQGAGAAMIKSTGTTVYVPAGR
jgi:hypothetical protein